MTAPAVIDALPSLGSTLARRRRHVALVERPRDPPDDAAGDPAPAPDPPLDRHRRAAPGDAGRARRIRQDDAPVRLGRSGRAALRVGHARPPGQRPGVPGGLDRPRRRARRAAAGDRPLRAGPRRSAGAGGARGAGRARRAARGAAPGGHARARVAAAARAAGRAHARPAARAGARPAGPGDGPARGGGDARARRGRAQPARTSRGCCAAPRGGRRRSRSGRSRSPTPARPPASEARTGWSPSTCATRSWAGWRRRCGGSCSRRPCSRR